MKWMFSSIGGVILLIALLFGLTWGGITWYRFFQPKRENARREVFEATRSYNQAKVQELAKYRLEYLRADDSGDRDAIASTVRLRFADYDRSQLPDELYRFLQEVNQ